jgi:hypothetical protein
MDTRGHFEVKDGNRLDILKKASNTPDYIARGWEIRKLLQDSVRENGWPQMPSDMSSLEGLFAEARKQVVQVWNEKIFQKLKNSFDKWANALEEAGCDTAEVSLLRNPEALNDKITIHQFGVLEGSMRRVIPDAWRELVLVASEKQLAELALARHWVQSLSEDEKQHMAEEFGFKNAFEIVLALDSAAFLGKYIDQAYVKQIELADSPDGSSETPLMKTDGDEAMKRGVKYVYDSKTEEGESDVKTYTEVFPFESKAIAKHLHTLADRTEMGLAANKLDKEYSGLPAYLHLMADAVQSEEKDPEKIYKVWQEVFISFRNLMNEGCPIMLMPQKTASVAGDANKVDWEIRFNFRTAQAKELENTLQPYRALAGEINKSIEAYLDKQRDIPPVFVGEQFVASGPNTNWFTRGEADEFSIVAHSNAVLDVARIGALPSLQKIFGNEVIGQEDFEKATLVDNSLHELGHAVATKRDDAILRRVGGKNNAKIIEELKADSTALKLVLLRLQKDDQGAVDYRAQLYAKLGDVCDYLKNKSKDTGAGKPYYNDGVAIISRLFDKQILVKKGDYYHITDDLKAIEAVAEISDEIIELYTTGTPVKVEEYLNRITARGDQADVKDFIKQIKS